MEKMVMNKKFWKNKKVLITGHNGFKGSWLTTILTMMEAKVWGLSLIASDNPTIYNLANINYLTELNEIIDIRNYSKLLHSLKQNKPDIIFHLAAQSIVGKSYENPIDTYSTNVMGTVNLLEAIRETQNIKCLINVTSDKCYENRETIIGYKEDDTIGGSDPYSNSKGCVELISDAYRKSYFNDLKISLATVRAGNVIGGGDFNEMRLIPDIFRSIDCNQPIEIRSLESIRPWQHVLEPLIGYIKIAELSYDSLNLSSGWNFGPNNSQTMTVEEVLIFFKKSFPNLQWNVNKNLLFKETKLLQLDVTKAKTYLNWKPKLTNQEALQMTIDWYLLSKKKYDMRSFTKKQISAYMDM